MVRNFDDAHLQSLQEHADVVAVESRTPSLEELFVAMMQAGDGDDAEARSGKLPVSSAEALP